MVQRLTFMVLLIAAGFLASGCSASLFKVKPVTELPPLADNAKSVDAGDGLVAREVAFNQNGE